MYRKDSMNRLLFDLEKNKIHHFKLVRGAYMTFESKLDTLYESKYHVDRNYNHVLYPYKDFLSFSLWILWINNFYKKKSEKQRLKHGLAIQSL